jgi:glycosyltransferase involved in cell wall biosynthesis
MISIILPTRKRTELLTKSVASLVDTAANKDNLEILVAYDSDDEESKDYFANPNWTTIQHKEFEFERQGYAKLHNYVNFLGEKAKGSWINFWCDDLFMLDEGWDEEVLSHEGFFGLLRTNTVNHPHPFAMAPIFPAEWVSYFGKVSPVTHCDWWLWNVCHLANRVIDIPIRTYHDRFDLTGNNEDIMWEERDYSADGKNPTNPSDWSHPDRRRDLITWSEKLKKK